MDHRDIVTKIVGRLHQLDESDRQLDQQRNVNNTERQELRHTLTVLARFTANEPDITQRHFAGMTIEDAALAYLQHTGRPATTGEIAEALERGGVEATVKDFYNKVYLTLHKFAGVVFQYDTATKEWSLPPETASLFAEGRNEPYEAPS